MLCEAVFDLISGHIDGMNTPAEEAALQAHLSECETCRRMLTAMEDIEFQTRSMQAVVPPTLKQNVMQSVNAETKKKKNAQRNRWIGPLAGIGAAAALLALTIGTGVIKLPQYSKNYASVAPAEGVQTESVADEADGYAEVPALEEEIAYEPAAQAPAYEPEEPAAEEAATVPASAVEVPAVETQATSEPGSLFTQSSEGADHDTRSPRGAFSDGGIPLNPPAVAAVTMEAYCEELCQRYQAPVLLLTGCDDTLVDALEFLSPELQELLADAERHELNDKVVLELDVDAAFALAEWLTALLPQDDRLPTEGALSEMLERIACYDPDGACLSAVTELPTGEKLELLRELYNALYNGESGFALYYPDEDYVPVAGDTVYVVLPIKPAE